MIVHEEIKKCFEDFVFVVIANCHQISAVRFLEQASINVRLSVRTGNHLIYRLLRRAWDPTSNVALVSVRFEVFVGQQHVIINDGVWFIWLW